MIHTGVCGVDTNIMMEVTAKFTKTFSLLVGKEAIEY